MEGFHIVDLGCGADIDTVLRQFNNMQSSFQLRQFNLPNFSPTGSSLNPEEFFSSVEERRTDRSFKLVGITAMPLSNNFFSQMNPTYNTAIISTDQSELYTPQFSVIDYLQEEILSCILLMLAQMDLGHYDTRGCLFDFCEDKRDIAIKLYTGSICSDCRARLVYYGVNDHAVVASQKVLWRISRDFHSGKVNRGCPIGYAVCQEYKSIQQDFSDTNIFFATSFRDEFLDMADHLRSKLREVGFTLKVVNEDISNKNILCKICKTMQTCKYGIAEFSIFRHNVTYEFGLMQAFGLQTVAVMRENKFADFEKDISDMKGIEVIPYKKISGDLFDRIKGFVGAI